MTECAEKAKLLRCGMTPREWQGETVKDLK
jgi:hypothetical protein